MDLDRTIRIVVSVSQLRMFRLRLFPRDCLRQSLLLYRTLRCMGHPAVIHFGVRKDGALLGHSWVTLDGAALAERISLKTFTTVYSHPRTLNSE